MAEQDAAAIARAAWDRGEDAAFHGDIATGRTWLERAHRFASSDQNLALALALMRLRDGSAVEAASLFRSIAATHGGREAWVGLAHCALALHDADGARAAVGRLLAAYAAGPDIAALAQRLVAAGGATSWCGLSDKGVLMGDWDPDALVVTLDDAPVWLLKNAMLPARWRVASRLSAAEGDAPLFGSPIDIQAICRTEGFVAAVAGRLEGWAWHPGAPATDPDVRVLDEGGTFLAHVTAREMSNDVSGATPAARPRRFAFAGLPDGLLRVVGRDGRDLLGSPLTLTPQALPMPRRARRRKPPTAGPVCVVIPVYRGRDTTLACVRSVLATLRPTDRVVVVNDASPDADLVADLASLAATGRIDLIASSADPGRNIGFPGAANAGLRQAGGQDAVLLNSDTLVFPGWLDGLQGAAHSAADIGTATPLSNDATLFSYPVPWQPNPMPAPAAGAHLAALAAHANAGLVVDVPTAHGFCMFIRADCLAATGLLRDDVFAQGYGEENDFTERACAAGYRHVGVPSVYVAHVGGASFGAARLDLLRRNVGLLYRLHPGYAQRVEAAIAADPLRGARARLDAARLMDGHESGTVLLVTHTKAGGTDRLVRERAAAMQAQGKRAVLLIGDAGRTEIAGAEAAFPNLGFALPAEWDALVDVLGKLRPVAVELHQLMGHDHAITRLGAHFGIPTDIWLHDYAWLCPRVAFVNAQGRFCGEAEPAVCETCLAASFRVIEDPIAPAALRRRSAADFAAARRVMVPHQDAAARVRRHFGGVDPVVHPLQDDQALPPRGAPPRGDRLRIAVAGAIGLAKGFDVLLDCARDAAARGLKLDFVVVGYSIGDAALMETGHVFVTGPFTQAESAALIRRQGASLAILPSIWPETWCYALTDLWQAGLDVAVFDIGAQAARVRQTGRGWVLPLGLPPGRVNDALLNLQPLADRSMP
jgi:GT2 family glycosyltransferase